jgi:hypothetical protein
LVQQNRFCKIVDGILSEIGIYGKISDTDTVFDEKQELSVCKNDTRRKLWELRMFQRIL